MDNAQYMRLTLELAEKGVGRVNPNPLVGAIIVKDGAIIGQGWHQKYGAPHAERNALASCTAPTQGATLYVNLEPCCHYGKTPPCTEAIIAAGIKRVVLGARDPNSLVAGQGIAQLRQAGIEVTEGVLAEDCARLNQVFFHYIKTKTPYVVLKYAMSMDGKIAAYTGKSQWISGEASRQHVQQQRHRYMGIMVGVGTVLADDPLLTCRLENGRNPIRVICDTHLRTPLESRIVQTAPEVPTIIATACADEQQQRLYRESGCEIITLGQAGGHLDLRELMIRLGERGLDSVLLEGGGSLNWSALNSGVVQKALIYIAPKLLGGATAPNPVMGPGVESPDAAFLLKNSRITSLGEDILIESEVLQDEK